VSRAALRIQARFFYDGDGWVAWTEQVPGAITDGRTLDEARMRLLDTVRRLGHLATAGKGARPRVLVEELEL